MIRIFLFVLLVHCLIVNVYGVGGQSVSSSSLKSEGHSGSLESTLLLRMGSPMTLKCEIFDDAKSDVQLKWFKNDVSIGDDDTRYKVFPENGTLEVISAAKDDVGKYRCQTMPPSSPENATIHVVYLTYKKMVKSLTVLQGDKLSLTCEVEGHPIPTVTWFKDGQNVEESVNSSRYELKQNPKGTPKGILTIEESDYPDRAEYLCSISIHDLQYNTTTFVRVKDMYAALWPFLGICVEVFLLCLIIFIYEKRRAKNDFEESDTDQPSEQKPSDNNQDSLRYRK